VGTVGDATVLGELPLGKGKVLAFGAILPQPVEVLEKGDTPHPQGLAAYGVTIAGGQVLHNALAYRRDGAPVPAAGGASAAPAAGDGALAATVPGSAQPALAGGVVHVGQAARRSSRA
jgi:hypothetical protein